MGTRDGYAHGTFSWVELATVDAAGAKAFYTELFGWDYADRPIGAGAVYSMARLDGGWVAALYASEQAPPHWNCYVTVDAVDETAQRCLAAGGTLAAEPFDVFDSGRMTVVQDPTGATVCLWEPHAHIGAGLVNGPGALSWNDLLTPDVEAAAVFYADALGWEVTPLAGAPANRHAISVGGRPNGGISEPAPGAAEAPAAWLAYFGSADLEADVATVVRAGGQVVAGPMPVPAGAFAVCLDPQGATFGLVSGSFDD